MNTDLESMLVAMAKHGRPNILQMSDGAWYCTVDMHVSATGAKFSIASEFHGNVTPVAAARQCAERIDAMLSGFTASRTPKAIDHA